jgi:transposase InsO family protein
VARQYGISTVWVGKLVARWRAGGWDAVEKQSTRPKSNPNAAPQATIDAVLSLRAQLIADGLDAGPHTLRAHLQRQGLAAPSVTTIWRILTRAGVVIAEPRKRPRRSYIRFQADLPNECWQADFTHWPLADGTDTEILSFLDDHSRYAISVTAHQVVTGPIVLATFRAAIETHGMPASTLTDNGLVFTTKYRQGRNSFERELVILGIEQKNGRPNHPQTQARSSDSNKPSNAGYEPNPAPATLPNCRPNSTSSPTTTTPPARIGHWPAAPPPRPTPHAPKPPPPVATGTGASATTRSTPPAPSPCATHPAYTTSASAQSTPAPPCGCSSTTYTSPSSPSQPARSSAT